MRRICHVALSALLVVGSSSVWAAGNAEGASTVKAKGKSDEVVTPRRRRHPRKSTEEVQEEERASGTKRKTEEDAPRARVAEPREARVEPSAEDDDSGALNSLLSARLPPRRYAYIAGGLLLATGLVFAFSAQGEAKRAQTSPSALEAQRAVASAQASAATANVMYVMAGVSVLLALLLEVLPEPIPRKASLTLHF